MTGETLRAIHERCKARHAKRVFDDDTHLEPECDHCCEPFPCDDYSDAVAALALLDAADVDIFKSTFARVPSSEFVDAVRLAPETRYRSIFDPDPLPVDATAREPAGDT